MNGASCASPIRRTRCRQPSVRDSQQACQRRQRTFDARRWCAAASARRHGFAAALSIIRRLSLPPEAHGAISPRQAAEVVCRARLLR